MSFTLALLIATVFWTGNGVAPTCHPNAVQLSHRITGYTFADGSPMWPAAVADETTCTAEISLDMVGAPAWELCQTMTHEVGHLFRLEHVTDGIMALNPAGYIPEACEHPKKFRRWWHRHHFTSAEQTIGAPGSRRWFRLNFYP